MKVLTWTIVFSLAWAGPAAGLDANQLLKEGDRLAWLRAWTAAEPHFVQAKTLFAAAGDARNALYAEVSAFRGTLPQLAVPAASARLAEYLEHPLVQSDDRLRLRVLVIKGEVDEDLDPTLAAQSWRAALALAETLGDAAWANRARAELGLVAFMQGDVGRGVIALGQAVKVAQANGDVSSLVRWVTLFGHGYVQLGRPEEALAYYDQALAAAAPVAELQFPVMTHVGRSNALIRLGRLDEADAILVRAGVVAAKSNALGYQAQLLTQRALIARQRGQTAEAAALFDQAMARAKAAGANRLIAEIALESSRMGRPGAGRAVESTLREGIAAARTMEERFLLPRLLAALADFESGRRRYTAAAVLLDEASDILRGLFTTTSSPWVQSRLVSGMDDVFVARIRLEGVRGRNAARMFAAIEDARGRALLELLANRSPLSAQKPPADLRDGERRISDLQRRLFRTHDSSARRRLLDEIFAAEEQLAPIATTFFDRSRSSVPQARPRLSRVQAVLRPDELLLEFALTNPASYVVVVTRDAARVQALPAGDAIRADVEALLKEARAGSGVSSSSAALATKLLSAIPELATHPRLLVSPDGVLHHLPFELLARGDRLLLDSHVVTYVPSGAVLAAIRQRAGADASRPALAVSASFAGAQPHPAVKGVTRDAFDLDPSKLRPLPAADDEARSVGALLAPAASTVLIGTAASEDAVKRQPLADYQVLHLAAHGIPSSRFPARAGLLLHPGGTDDGMLQAREILWLPLRATLVTLSACDTGSGSVHGQDGPASLVRPFLAAGARTVVANLWAADDDFSLALMREFYRRLGDGRDVAEALRDAKRHLLKTFGPRATPRLWSGVLAYGDGRGVVAAPRAAINR